MEQTLHLQESLHSSLPLSKHLGTVSLETLQLLFHVEHLAIANALAQLLTVPPYAVSAVVLALLAYTTDRLQNRGIFVGISSTLGGIGYM